MQHVYIDFFCDIKIVSEANCSEHWSKKRKRRKAQQMAVWLAFKQAQPEIPLPCVITLTRLGKREMDYDNLVSSLKYVRDAVADQIFPGKAPGQADSSDKIEWLYSQKKSNQNAVNISLHGSSWKK